MHCNYPDCTYNLGLGVCTGCSQPVPHVTLCRLQQKWDIHMMTAAETAMWMLMMLSLSSP
jgi:hypothetical protein